MIIEALVTKVVVDGQYGEVTVTCVPDDKLENLQLAVSTKPLDPVTSPVPPLAFLPDNEGYVVPTAEKAATITRRFAIKPVTAEPGKTYLGELQVTWKNGTPMTKTFPVPVEARPEVYAALGAVEHLRRTLLGAYESFKQVGKSVHQGTALPEASGEFGKQALDPATFQWALEMVEKGTRIFRQTTPDGTKKNV